MLLKFKHNWCFVKRFSLVHNPATIFNNRQAFPEFFKKVSEKISNFFQYDRYFKSETKNSKTYIRKELFKANHLQAITFGFRFLAALFGSVALI